ncbi:DUF5684 domain-containing protein [Geomonas silvestris]|nr:DUF5684 domain-containing protein [Geomonas silvestris]
MKSLLRTGMLFFVVWLALSGVSFAKQVYLSDGSVLECESFWRRQGQIVVKVNRDVMLEFAPSEVNLRKTFPHKAKAKGMKPKRPVVQKTATAESAASPAPGNVVPAAARREDAQPAAPAEPKHPAAAPPAAVQPAAPAAAPPVAAVQKEVVPEPAAAAPEQGPLSKAEFERRAKENAERLAEAIKKKNPELIKKAMGAQKELVQQQRQANAGGPGAAAPKPAPPNYTYLFLLLFCGLLTLVSMWVVFGKAGEAGWKVLVPLYNIYLLMRISGKPGWWFILLLIPVIGLAINLLAMLSLAEKFGRSPAFGVGLLLLPMLFFPLLAFGDSQYQDAVPAPEMNFSFAEEP